VRRRLLLLAWLPQWAAAQEVWRCGPAGRSYAQQPCPGGRRIDVPEPRPADDVAAARAVAAREAALADRMRRERLDQEARHQGSGLIAIGPEPVPLRPQPVVVLPRRPRLQPRRRPPAGGGT